MVGFLIYENIKKGTPKDTLVFVIKKMEFVGKYTPHISYILMTPKQCLDPIMRCLDPIMRLRSQLHTLVEGIHL